MNTSGTEDKGSKNHSIASVGAARQIPFLDNRLESRDLFVASREITIAHGGEIYRLRLTAQNKLILTK
ncbi:MAG: hemin uptake protein HemP [Pseudolabrys sp.]|nr:hemin uptake protein HemP [Pseudolabrys sp.]